MYRLRKEGEAPRWIELSGDCRRDLHAAKVGYNFTVRIARGLPPLSRIELDSPRPILTELGKLVERHFIDTLITRQDGAIWNKCFVVMPDHIHFCVWVNERIKQTINQYFTKAMLFAEKEARTTFGIPELWQRPGDLFICYSWETFQQKIAYNEANIERWKMDRQLRHLSHPHILPAHPKLDSAYAWEGYGELPLLDESHFLPCYVSRQTSDAAFEKFARLAVTLARAGWVMVGGFVSPRERELLARVRAEADAKVIHLAATRLADDKVPAKLAKALYAGRFLRLTSAEQQEKCTRELCVWHNLWIDQFCGNWREQVTALFETRGMSATQRAGLARFLAAWLAPDPRKYYGSRPLLRADSRNLFLQDRATQRLEN